MSFRGKNLDSMWFVLLLVATSVSAQVASPDSELAALVPLPTVEVPQTAPANSCYGLEGAAFGLCIAYCEALDCDGANSLATADACTALERTYAKVTQSVPPCLCPCVNQIEGYVQALNGDFGLDECIFFGEEGVSNATFIRTDDGRFFGGENFLDEIGFCGFAFGGDTLFIEPTAADQCVTLIEKAAEDADLQCNAPGS